MVSKYLILLLVAFTCLVLQGCGGSSSGAKLGNSNESDITPFADSKLKNNDPRLSVEIEFSDNMDFMDALKIELDVHIATDNVADLAHDDLSLQWYICDEDDPNDYNCSFLNNQRKLRAVHYREDGTISVYDHKNLGYKQTNKEGRFILTLEYYGLFTKIEYDNIKSGQFLYSIESRYYSSRKNGTLISSDEFPDGGVFTYLLGEQRDSVDDYSGSSSIPDIRSVKINLNLPY